MRRLSAVAWVLLWSGPGAEVSLAGDVDLHFDRRRCYGGEEVSVHVVSSGAELLRWETSVAGAPIERGRVRIHEDGRGLLLVRAPEVERRSTMTARAQLTTFENPTASCAVRVFPAYDGSHLKRLFASATVAVAEVRDEISSRLARFGLRYEKASGRLALRLFEGDVLVASGRWWAGEGRFLGDLLRAQLRRGVRIVVVDCAGGGLSFSGAPEGSRVGRLAVSDRRHPLARSAELLEGWGDQPALVLELGNFRKILVDSETDAAAVLEEFPPEGGAILRVSLPLLSRFEGDPAAPILFERCVEWALEAETPEWRQVAFRLGEADDLRERLGELGVRGARGEGKDALPQRRDGLLLVSADELGDEVRDWIAAGGKAAVLVPGSPATPPSDLADAPVTRGISLVLARRLCAAGGDDDTWNAAALAALGGDRRALVAGLLDVIEADGGRAYVLRVGPAVESLTDEKSTHPWREFLAQVFTNLGVRLGEGGEDE